MKRDNQVTGNMGLYYACYHLSKLGWNVMPTARNAKGIDIIAYSADAKCMIGVQVKALSKRNAVPLGNSLDKVIGDYWVIVNKLATESPEVFVLFPEEVRNLAAANSSQAKTMAYWLNPKDYDKPEFKGWGRIRMSATCEDI